MLLWLYGGNVSFPWKPLPVNVLLNWPNTGRCQVMKRQTIRWNPRGPHLRLRELQLLTVIHRGRSTYSHWKTHFHTCERRACTCFTAGSLNDLPVRFKLSINLKLIGKVQQSHICLCIQSHLQKNRCVHTLYTPYCACLLHTHTHAQVWTH